MAGAKKEQTHKHRNILDDMLDLGLVLMMVAWYFTGVELDKETLAMLGGAGASARVFLRRILMHFWGDKIEPRDPTSEDTVRTEPPDPDEQPEDDSSEEDREEGDEET